MANEDNYNVLRDAFLKWRDATGKVMRDDFRQYVELNNKAAVLNGNYLNTGLLYVSGLYEDLLLYYYTTAF